MKSHFRGDIFWQKMLPDVLTQVVEKAILIIQDPVMDIKWRSNSTLLCCQWSFFHVYAGEEAFQTFHTLKWHWIISPDWDIWTHFWQRISILIIYGCGRQNLLWLVFEHCSNVITLNYYWAEIWSLSKLYSDCTTTLVK